MSKPVDAILPPGPRLAGRRIIVTGAASGMGKGITELFAAEGAKLALIDVQTEALKEVAGRLHNAGCTPIDCDLAKEDDIVKAVEIANNAMGGIDGIVNAAGILRTLPLEETTPEIWRKVQDVNLFGPYFLCNTALPYLRAAGEATIVNIASTGGLITPVNMVAYGASKHGLIGLTKGQATEWSPAVRSNAIAPGFIKTPMTDALNFVDENGESIAHRTNGLFRVGTPTEIAYLALFLTSRESSFINGATYVIDGGPGKPYDVSNK